MKIKSLIVCAVLVTAVFGFGFVAQAQTVDNASLIAMLQAQIQALMQQIAAMQAQISGTTTPTTPTTSGTPLCPFGMTWLANAIPTDNPNGRGLCVANPTCPSGMTWLANAIPTDNLNGRGLCVANPTCPTGTTWTANVLPTGNPNGRGACLGGSTQPCPEGQDFFNDINKCYSSRSCSVNQDFDPQLNKCITRASCSVNQDFDPQLNKCITRASCSVNQDLDMQLNKCTARSSCPSNKNFDVQLNMCVGQTTSIDSSDWCHTFTMNLGFVNSGSTEVQNLQIALQQQGIIPTGAVSGIYDQQLAQYVVQFQARYGLTQTGYVGSVTRAKLNALYGCTTEPPQARCNTQGQCVVGGTGAMCLTNADCPLVNQPTITVTSQNSSVGTSEVWEFGKTYTVTWNQTGLNNANLDIGINNLTTGHGYRVAQGVLGSLGRYSFTLPSLVAGEAIVTGDGYRVYVDYPNSSGGMTGVYSIGTVNVQPTAAQPSITVTSPNGGETLIKGQTYRIQWNSTNVTGAYIKLRKGADTYNGLEGSIGSVQGTNFISWTVPTTLPNGSDYAIRVLDTATSVLDDSNGYFTISAPTAQPSITVTSPNGGESWQVGTTHNITWTSTNLSDVQNITPNVIIQLRSTSDNWTFPIATRLAYSSPFAWTIPTTLNSTNASFSLGGAGKQYQIIVNPEVISGASIPNSVIGVSNSFSITAPISSCPAGRPMVNPLDGQCYECKTDSDCASNQTNHPGETVCTRAVSTWTYGVCSLPVGTSSATQPVVNIIGFFDVNSWTQGSTQRIRYSTPNIDMSACVDAYAVTSSGSKILLHTGGSIGSEFGIKSFQVGTTIAPGSYKIELDAHYCTSTSTAFIASAVSSSSITITSVSSSCPAGRPMVNPLDGQCYECKTDSDCASNQTNHPGEIYCTRASATWTYGVCSLPANTQPSIIVTSPNGGENWQIGSTHNITWNSTKISTNVLIQAVASATVLRIASVPASQGAYSWTVGTTMDGVMSSSIPYKIKISEDRGYEVVESALIKDYGDDYFHITQPVATNKVQALASISNSFANLLKEFQKMLGQ